MRYPHARQAAQGPVGGNGFGLRDSTPKWRRGLSFIGSSHDVVGESHQERVVFVSLSHPPWRSGRTVLAGGSVTKTMARVEIPVRPANGHTVDIEKELIPLDLAHPESVKEQKSLSPAIVLGIAQVIIILGLV